MGEWLGQVRLLLSALRSLAHVDPLLGPGALGEVRALPLPVCESNGRVGGAAARLPAWRCERSGYKRPSTQRETKLSVLVRLHSPRARIARSSECCYTCVTDGQSRRLSEGLSFP